MNKEKTLDFERIHVYVMYTEEKKSRGSFEKGDIPQKKGHFSLPDFDMKRKSIEANSP